MNNNKDTPKTDDENPANKFIVQTEDPVFGNEYFVCKATNKDMLMLAEMWEGIAESWLVVARERLDDNLYMVARAKNRAAIYQDCARDLREKISNIEKHDLDPRAAFERAAQICQYYLKHQDHPSGWMDMNEYQRGVYMACKNLEELILQEARRHKKT